jgi:hypothetical protein
MGKRERKKTVEELEQEIQEYQEKQMVEEQTEKAFDLPVEEEIVVQEKETTEVVPTPGKWKKIGKGAFLWKNRYIKPGQIFEAYRSEIPTAFLDSLEEVEPEVKGVDIPQIKKMEFHLEQNDEGLWNILDIHNRVLNETPMEKEEAEKILKELL